jgi:glucoamylase
MPLTWAHAEYIKLAASLKTKRIFDMPRRTVKRYIDEKKTSPFHIWRFDRMSAGMPRGKTLRIELLAPAIVRWSDNGWNAGYDLSTVDTGAGIHLADIPAGPDGPRIFFTFYWTETNTWENKDFSVVVR